MKKILLILLVLVVCLLGLDSQAIGVPSKPIFSSNNFTSTIKSATFSLDGNNMYTYINGLVTIYETNPMKKVSSFHIKPDKSLNYGHKRQKIFVTKDKKRIIFYSPQYIQLWDIQKEKLLKKILLFSRNAVYSKKGLLVLTENYFIEILDDIDLNVMSRSTSPYIIKDIPHYDDRPFDILTNNNTVLLFLMRWVIFLDLETLKIIDKTEYDTNVMKYVKKYKEDFSPFLKFQLENHDSYTQYYVHSFESNNELIIFSTLMLVNNIFLIRKYKNIEEKSMHKYILLQNNDDWLFYDVKTHAFIGSKNIKKYLKMKIQDGKVVPINDTTFKKYNQQINLKD